MSFRPVLFLAAIGSLTLASCSIFRKAEQPEPVVIPEVAISARNNPMDIYRATPDKAWELVHTGIDIRFRIAERTASATARLRLHPYFYDTDSVVLDAKAMKILSVRDGQDQALPYRYDTLQLRVQLPRSYRKEDTLQLTIQYIAMPYAFEAGGGKAITQDRGLYFINADGAEPYKPVQIWTQGETEAGSHWFPTFDKPNYRSAFEITMHVPDSFRSLSNGVLIKSVKETGGLRADTWKQDKPIPPYLVMMAAGNYHVAKETWRGREVSYYVPQQYAAYAKDIFNHTPEMMEFFSNLLGVEYPWDKYAQVIGYDYVSGAMENVSASLFGAFNLKDRRQLADESNDFIVAHELFHQWFGDYVTAESWSNLTLNESFADYAEHLWQEHKYGKVAAQQTWMQGLSKYLVQARWSDPPLLRFHYLEQDDMFDRISYSKGGLILHYLRQLTGDKAFFAALNLYLTRNALHSAEVPQLRLAFEEVTGKDWNWFFDQWYYRGGHPRLKVSYDYMDAQQQVKVTVQQLQADSAGVYRLPLKAQLLSGGKARETDWLLRTAKDTFVYAYENGQRPLIVPDAGHWMPGTIDDKKSAEQWKTQLLYANDHISKRLAVKALAEQKDNDTAAQALLLALQDKDPYIRFQAVYTRQYDTNKKVPEDWTRLLGKIAADDPNSKARAVALQALGDMKLEQYSTLMEQAIQDSSYRVAAAGLMALDKINHNRAVGIVRSWDFSRMNYSALYQNAAIVLGKEGKKEDYPFYEQTMLHLFESDRLSFLYGFTDYLKQVKDESVYRKGINLVRDMAVRDPAPGSGLFMASSLYKVYKDAALQAGAATDKVRIEDWKLRRDIAAQAWKNYKDTVKDEDIKMAISEMEKS
jgi:aminopeptidase N